MLREFINRALWTIACWLLVPVAVGLTFGVIVLCGMAASLAALGVGTGVIWGLFKLLGGA